MDKICISLTGENSHKLTIPPGQGSFAIGTKGISEGKYDVYVEKDSRINWNAWRAERKSANFLMTYASSLV